MALDTTIGGASADSYVALAAADAYHVAHGTAAEQWSSLSAAVREAALRTATDYLDATYSWVGIKNTKEQRLQWPRSWVDVDDYAVEADEYPRRLTDACCELARRAAAGELAPDLDTQIVTGEAVGPLSVTYSENQRNGGRAVYDLVESMLAPLLEGGGRGNVPVVRA